MTTETKDEKKPTPSPTTPMKTFGKPAKPNTGYGSMKPSNSIKVPAFKRSQGKRGS